MNRFVHIPQSLVRDLPRLGPNALAVYVCMLAGSYEDGECPLSQRDMSRATGIQPKEVSRAVGKLKRMGLIAMRRWDDPQDGTQVEYRITEVPRVVEARRIPRPACIHPSDFSPELRHSLGLVKGGSHGG